MTAAVASGVLSIAFYLVLIYISITTYCHSPAIGPLLVFSICLSLFWSECSDIVFIFFWRLCIPVPIDAVYTWVNGSDPDLILQLHKVKLSMEEQLNITRWQCFIWKYSFVVVLKCVNRGDCSHKFIRVVCLISFVYMALVWSQASCYIDSQLKRRKKTESKINK